MVYYSDSKIIIRDMNETDAQILVDGEIKQGWHSTIDKYFMRLNDRITKQAVCMVAEFMGEVAGYINVYPNASEGAFANSGYPEIVDLGVLKKYQRKGIGDRLMTAAERIASKYADTVYLGVGLHSGYGSAQRMYVKRGYIPDGSGVWYGDKVCEQYKDCCNDDDLVLYLSKKL